VGKRASSMLYINELIYLSSYHFCGHPAVVGVSCVQFLTHVEVWAYFDHGFEPGAPTWQ
jgi:hypothetical protein